MLRDRRRADVQVLRELLDRRDERLGQHQPAQAPAGHAEVFREAVDRDDVVAVHQRAVAEALVVAQAEIDLVDDREAAACANRADDAAHLVRIDRGAGRVGR